MRGIRRTLAIAIFATGACTRGLGAAAPALRLGPVNSAIPTAFPHPAGYRMFIGPNDLIGDVGLAWVGNSTKATSYRIGRDGNSAAFAGLAASNFTNAWAANLSGTVVGAALKTSSTGANLGWFPVRWEPGSITPTELALPGTAPDGLGTGAAFGVNASGLAVGYFVRDGDLHALRWDAGTTTAVELSSLPGTKTYSQAFAVNAGGTVIGGSVPSMDRAVRWDAGSTVAVELLPAGYKSSDTVTSYAHAINDAGVIVGAMGPPIGYSTAVRWAAGSNAGLILEGLGAPTSGPAESNAVAVDAAGNAYGYAMSYTAAGQRNRIRAVRWDAAGTAPNRLAFPATFSAGFGTVVRDANNSGAAAGAVVVDTVFGTYDGAQGALVWTADGNVIDLNVLLNQRASSATPDGAVLVLKDARSIDDTGWVSCLSTSDADGSGSQPALMQMISLLVPEAGTYGRGDANFDTKIDFNDLVLLAQHYNESNANQNTSIADFGLNGVVDFNDLVTLAQNYNSGTPNLDGFAPEFAADWILAQSLVPEPTTLLLAGGVVAAFSRRRCC